MSAPTRNPFTLKVGQVMTGFGAGCGIGLGVGYPIALGSIPVLGEMMSATSNAGSRAFGGLGHRAFGMLRKLGIKNLKAGVGCGVGIGHGFGVGIALKPGVSQQLMHSLQESLSAVTSRLQKHLPSQEGETQEAPASEQESPAGDSLPGNKSAETPNKSTGYVPSDASSAVKTEPLKAISTKGTGEVQDLRQENEILRTLLRHQELIDDIKGQNASILRVLSEQFDVEIGEQGAESDRNLEVTRSHRAARKNDAFHHFHSHSKNDHRKCFDCRISARRRR
ncbi:unnamed protein product [Calypogeia fissa]